MDDEEDLKKIVDIINVSKKEINDDFQYQDFINCDESDRDEESEEDDPLPITDSYNFDTSFKINISAIYKYIPTPTLKPEEKSVIDSCEDPDLKKLLILNRQKNIELIQLYKKFKDLLIECKQNLVEKNDILKQYFAAHKIQSQSSGSWRLGSPYFKDRDFYVAPLNDDAMRKKRNNELSYFDLMPLKKWTSYECDRLLKAVKVNFNLNRITELKKQIRSLAKSDDEFDKIKVDELELKVKELESTENLEVPPLGSDENINWIRVSELFVGSKHSDLECRSFWHIYLHPEINKSKWTKSETKKLLELVKKYKRQNWIQIAKELGTNRSGFNVCIHYFNNYHNTFKKGEFTFTEDRKLLELVAQYRMGNFIPWVKIVRHFKNRTRSQIHHRFTYYLSQIDKKTGKFTEAEDVIIMLCVEKFGRDFKKCSEFLPERSAVQIKTRYSSSLWEVVKKGSWTVEEDKRVVEFVKGKGTMWSVLSREMHRSSGQIRQRFQCIQAFFEKHPDKTLEDVPRRKHISKCEVTDYSLQRQLVDRFKYEPFIPSIQEVEKILVQLKSEVSTKTEVLDVDDEDYQEPDEEKLCLDVDELLTEFFLNNSDQDITDITPQTLKKTVDDVELLLDILKVNLEIPKQLETYSNLDSLDKSILTELRNRQVKGKNKTRNILDLKQLVPINFYSTTGIRSLLIKNFKFKSNSSDRIFSNMDMPTSIKARVKSELTKEMSRVNNSDLVKIKMERTLFFRRFVSVFKWPSILTLENPSKELISVSQNFTRDSRPPVTKTYSRKRNNEESTSTQKIRVIEEDPKEVLKLKPVTDKSVIVNLIKDTSKKLFCLDEITCGDKIKTLIKEVDLNFLPSRKDESVQSSSKLLAPKVDHAAIAQKNMSTNVSNLQILKMERIIDNIFESETSADEMDISDIQLTDTSDIFDAGDNDLIDLEKLTHFIKSEKHF